MKRILLFFIAFAFLACGDKDKKTEGVFFAGEIVNPTSDYVVLYKNEIVIDSAKLDDNNRFYFALDTIDSGLHHFDHAPELQYVYLEKGDSLMVRLNTVAFDESLVFSGSNEDVNNFMIEMFLNYEDEDRLVNSYYKLAPDIFSSKIDSLRNQNLNELELLMEDGNLSKNAYAMAKASIDYNSFLFKEKYPFYHRKRTGEETLHELDPGFYNYRTGLDMNNKDLAYFRPYYDYMKYHLGNLSYMTCAVNCGMDMDNQSVNYLHLNKHKMAMIDSLVVEKELRNNLFRNVTMDYLLKMHDSSDDCDKFISDFEQLSSNESHKEEITNLYRGIKNLQAHKEIPHLLVQDVNGQETTLKNIAKNDKTVFYFWTGSQKRHFKNVSKHIARLEIDYPEYSFVGINLRTGHPQWLSMLAENKVDTKNQYWGKDFEAIQNTLIIDGLNKCLITEDSLIVDAFANLYRNFRPQKKALVVK
ncbi:MAG: transaldolase [Croceitalea sp.]|nr:transaldolase [Croceitalea sp.]NNC35359.1 transaldolase [Croceitalea sp.]NNL10027.1 transaldolase [Croceitalea sp.]